MPVEERVLCHTNIKIKYKFSQGQQNIFPLWKKYLVLCCVDFICYSWDVFTALKDLLSFRGKRIMLWVLVWFSFNLNARQNGKNCLDVVFLLKTFFPKDRFWYSPSSIIKYSLQCVRVRNSEGPREIRSMGRAWKKIKTLKSMPRIKFNKLSVTRISSAIN